MSNKQSLTVDLNELTKKINERRSQLAPVVMGIVSTESDAALHNHTVGFLTCLSELEQWAKEEAEALLNDDDDED